MIEIKQIKENTKGRFAAMDNDKEAGAIFYTSAGESKIILMKIVDFARENNIKIIPLCPFAKSVFDKTESIRDVLV